MELTSEQRAFIAKNWRDLVRPRALEIDAHTPTYARLRCEPLERGFGTTLGVTLRRTLLSTTAGAAITHAIVEAGAETELAALLLALKEVVLATDHVEGVVVRLDKREPGLVTAHDLALVEGVRCCNPALVLGTTTEPVALGLVIGVGRGYAPASAHVVPVAGAIAIDALFSPIRRVDFSVTNARIGHQTDYDRLTMEVWTNGAVDPVGAVERAAGFLRDGLGVFINFDEVPEPRRVPREDLADKPNENLWRTVDELELSVRATNCLRNLNIRYIGELVQKTEATLLKSRGFGRKSLQEIADVLAEMKLGFGMQLDGWSAAGLKR
ncbi:MAG: DNA-directed RNA polymerase subunit alpha [Kofleriaceae bacterium]|nr:DNA-directed RNA polymerase subunit alpha [Kofleriaceae bacterium]